MSSTSHIDDPGDNTQTGEPESAKQIITIDELGGRCAYFPHTDFHNINDILSREYETMEGLRNSLTDRLLHYLLCFDTILIHCSDPLRKEMVFDILQSNASLITDGAIRFVFSSSVNDIKHDYKIYIERKIAEYKTTPNSESEIASLTQKHIDDAYYTKVIGLLDESPYLLQRSNSGSAEFKELIEHDLKESERITMHKKYLDESEIYLLNLTLDQLLHLQTAEKGPIYLNDEIDEFTRSWKRESEKAFSRHTITTKLKEIANKKTHKKPDKPDYTRDRLVETVDYRLSVLFAKTYSAGHFLLELDYKKEWGSLYSWRFIRLFLEHIAGKKIVLNAQVVQKIRNEKKLWTEFKKVFALSMCDLHMRTSFTHPKDLKNYLPTAEEYKSVLAQFKYGDKLTKIKEIILEDQK